MNIEISEEAERLLSGFHEVFNVLLSHQKLPECTIGQYVEQMIWDQLCNFNNLPIVLDKVPEKPLGHSPEDWEELRKRIREAKQNRKEQEKGILKND